MVEYFLGYNLLLSENLLSSFFYSFSPEEIVGDKLLFFEEVLGTKLLDAEIILGDTFLFLSVFSNIIYLQHYRNTNTRIDDTPHYTGGHGFEPQPEPPPMHVDTSVSMWIKKACLPCWPLQSAGLAPEVNLGITKTRKYARDIPWFWNPGQTSPGVQNRGISSPTKRTHVLKTKNKKKIAGNT